MNAFAAIVFASLLSRLGYQMARSPVLPAFAADLGALPEAIGVLTLLVVLWLPDVDRPSDSQVTTLAARTAEFREGLVEVVATPPILIAAGIEAIMYLGYGAFLGFLPIYAKTVGLNDAEIAIVLGSQLATAVVAKPIGGRLSDGLDESRLLSSASSSAPPRFRLSFGAKASRPSSS